MVDYYREDEPIELGPDENMHDQMIEAIAELSVRRGYVLGSGIMSSKKVGINHKQYGVTSLGVVTFAEIAMREQGIDIRHDAFSVKLTGGPNGDVAGNALRLLLERCPRVSIRLIVDGTAALVDPAGLRPRARCRASSCAPTPTPSTPNASPPAASSSTATPGGPRGCASCTAASSGPPRGLREDWVTVDEFHKEFDELLFAVPADLFIPAGGRPETIDRDNWRQFLGARRQAVRRGHRGGRELLHHAGGPAAAAGGGRGGAARRVGQQVRRHLLLLRDHRQPAPVCGRVPRSTRRSTSGTCSRSWSAGPPTRRRLILRRQREEGGKRSFTEISDAISVEINANKARLFAFFQSRPELAEKPLYRRALLAHLPRLVREHPAWRDAGRHLPSKYRSAILAAEIGAAMVYRRPLEPDFASAVEEYVTQMFE